MPIVAIASEKGGVGKSTITAQLEVSFLHAGLNVGAIDLDPRQRSMVIRHQNRKAINLRCPKQGNIDIENFYEDLDFSETKDIYLNALDEVKGCDWIFVDCAGSNSHLIESAIVTADVILTPTTPRLVDWNMLGIWRDGVLHPSEFTRMVQRLRNVVMRQGAQAPAWLICPNKVPVDDTPLKKKRQREFYAKILPELSARFQFEIGPTIKRRDLYEDLMDAGGATPLDYKIGSIGAYAEKSEHIAANNEINQLSQAVTKARLRRLQPA